MKQILLGMSKLISVMLMIHKKLILDYQVIFLIGTNKKELLLTQIFLLNT